ncbi:MAG: metallophosphoesterase [Proteobacteria bacterium]|nr:metallophosphoesterase [Pseudomonadota bacterium]
MAFIFFGGTMWMDFNGGDFLSMEPARQQMNDFQLIRAVDGERLTPAHTVEFHRQFVDRLTAWFEKGLSGPRVVISHHAPVINPNTQYRGSPLMPAFNSLDMIKIIEKYQPALWVYGHTHECDDQMIGDTRIISNQLGYPRQPSGYECAGFDPNGKLVDV